MDTSGDKYVGFFGGIVSGATKLAIGHPFDTIKVRMQTQGKNGRFKGLMDCIRSTIRKEGYRAMYKGATPPLFGWALMDAIQMGTLTNLRIRLRDGDQPLSLTGHAVAGLGAGIVVSFVATPIEVVKAGLQTQYSSEGAMYKGPIDCAKKLFQESGIRGLYKGLGGCLLFRSQFWVLWGSYEGYTRLLLKNGMESSMIPFFAGGLAANTFWTWSFPTGCHI